jgi:hypothetical protein
MNTFNQGAQMRAQQQFGTPGEFGSLQNSVRTVPDQTMVDPTMVNQQQALNQGIDPAMVKQQQALNLGINPTMVNQQQALNPPVDNIFSQFGSTLGL